MTAKDVTVDRRRRISLGDLVKFGDRYLVEVTKAGHIVLIPAQVVPVRPDDDGPREGRSG